MHGPHGGLGSNCLRQGYCSGARDWLPWIWPLPPNPNRNGIVHHGNLSTQLSCQESQYSHKKTNTLPRQLQLDLPIGWTLFGYSMDWDYATALPSHSFERGGKGKSKEKSI